MPNAVTAETAAIERAILVFLSFFFSAFNLDNKTVSSTLFSFVVSSGFLCSLNLNSELIIHSTLKNNKLYGFEVRIGSKNKLFNQNEINFVKLCLEDHANNLFHNVVRIVCLPPQ